MAKLIISERQYKLIVNHIRENANLDPKSKAIVDDILGSLNEGSMDGILAKVQDYAKKGLITATVLSALMAAPQLTQAQKSQIQDYASQSSDMSVYQPAPKAGTVKADNVVSVNIMAEWNEYVKWLKAKGLSGDKRMNHIPFSKQAMATFKQEHPQFNLSYDHVTGIQKAMRRYRDFAIDMFKHNPNGGSPDTTVKKDMSNFMSWVMGTGDDGIAGEYTSQFIFPKKFFEFEKTGKKVDLGYADPALQNKK